MSTLSPAEVQYEQAHIYQQKSTTNIIVLSVFTFVAFVALCVRLASRKIQRAGFALDDYLIVIGMAFTIVNVLAGCEESHYAIGRHIITLTPHDLVLQGKWELVNLYSFTTSMALIKLSILTFMVRLFGINNRAFRIAVWLLAGYIILWAIALYFAYGFQCRPFSRNWSLTEPCKAPLRLDYSATILSTVHDVALLTLPQPVIWRLQMPRSRKLAISSIFVIGFVATLMGIIKIAYINGAPGAGVHKVDATYNTSVALVFTSLEPVFGVTCACLPATPAFFSRVARTKFFSRITSLLGSPSHTSSPKEPYSNDNEASGGSWVRLDNSGQSISKDIKFDKLKGQKDSEEFPFDELRPKEERRSMELV